MSEPNKIDQLLNGPSSGSPTGAAGGAPSGPPPASIQPAPPAASIRPAPPKSPFGNMPIAAATGQMEFDPGEIEKFGKTLIDTVGSHITTARGQLNGKPRQVEAGAFTTFCATLAQTYVQATEYADVDLITKARFLKEVDEKLALTAKLLRAAEHSSTTK